MKAFEIRYTGKNVLREAAWKWFLHFVALLKSKYPEVSANLKGCRRIIKRSKQYKVDAAKELNGWIWFNADYHAKRLDVHYVADTAAHEVAHVVTRDATEDHCNRWYEFYSTFYGDLCKDIKRMEKW